MELSDEALCERVASRDEAAFNLLVERYRERAYRLAWSILHDAEDARDLSRKPSSDSTKPRPAFGDGRGFPRGSTGSWSTSAWITDGNTSGGARPSAPPQPRTSRRPRSSTGSRLHPLTLWTTSARRNA